MSPKLIVFLACMVLASASHVPHKRSAEESAPHEQEEPVNYSFTYDINDSETGDVKSQSETRNGDFVQGHYTVNDADGYQRIVEYSVNGDSGFNAVVRREPLGEAAAIAATEAAPVPVKKILPAPIVKHSQQQQQHQQIILKTFAPPPTYVRAYAAPAVVHHAPAHTLIHHAQPAVHIAPATHYVHAAPGALLKTASPAVYTQHHAPAATHTLVKTHFSAPHVQYVY